MSKQSNNAWVTLITNDKYLEGIITVAYSLIEVKSKYKMIILYTFKISNRTKNALAKLTNCEAREIQPIKPSSQIKYACPLFEEIWSKLKIFELTEFNKVIWLDADMLLLRNMDELFDLDIPADHIGACADCLCNPFEDPNPPEINKQINCYHFNRNTEVSYFNAGMIIVHPSIEMYNSLMTAMATWDLQKFLFAEQDLLNRFFKGKWYRVDNSYNCFQAFMKSHPKMFDLNRIKNIHFAGPKPWEFDVNSEERKKHVFSTIIALWWEHYENARKYYGYMKNETLAMTPT